MMSKGIAILGAGMFARSEHVPAVKSCPNLTLKAIYSRSKRSADKLAKEENGQVDTYFEAPSATGRSLNDLLARDDIHAVIIALPICIQPTFIKRALAAGKHVLSEKPIAPDVDAAIELLQWYETTRRREIWSVGENFRFMKSFHAAEQQIRKMDSEITAFSVRLFALIDDEDQAYQKEWRRNPGYPGGPILDCGIHYVAGIRYLLAAAGEQITHVHAFTSQANPYLEPLDTVSSTMQLANGSSGSFAFSMGSKSKKEFHFEVVMDNGTVTATQDRILVQQDDANGKKTVKQYSFEPWGSVEIEVQAFAQAIQTGRVERRASPEEALADLRVVQAMLESGEDGGIKSLV